jgi:signal transduction histidine kinase
MQLQEHPLFVTLARDPNYPYTDWIDAVIVRNYAANEVIFDEGSPPDALFLVLEGNVSFHKTLPDGRQQHISNSQAGQFFGEIGVLTDAPRALRAVASSEARLALIPKDIFIKAIQGEKMGPFAQLFNGIIQHLHYTTHQYIADLVQQEKMALVGTMINGLIHDFKNPFSVINMSAQLIAGEHSDDLTQELCRTIEEQVRHVLVMASDISEFSQGKRQLTLGCYSLKNLFDRFCDLNPILCKDSHISLSIQVPDIEIECEDIKLLRVIQNLVVNAFDACRQKLQEQGPNGPFRGLVQVSAQDLGSHVELHFKDNGKGIPACIRDKLFKPFVTHGKPKGTGLGAAIVKSIIENHGGSIRFETQTDVGTLFVLTLPKKQPHLRE